MDARRFFPSLLLVAQVALVWALLAPAVPAQVQRNAGFEQTVFAITKTKLVVSPQEEMEQGTLVIRDGLIVAMGKDIAIPADAEVIDGTGLVVYPGFIDAGTSVLLDPNRGTTPVAGRPIDFARFALAATPPDNRKSLTPEFEVPQGLKTDLAGIEQRRKAGFTAVHIVPSGRIAGGKGALLTTSGLPLREALLDGETFPEFQLFNPPGGGYPATLMGAVAHLRQAFLDARRLTLHHRLYDAQTPGVGRPPEDPALDALGEIADKKQTSLFIANGVDDIHRALDFADEQQIPAVVWGAREGYQCLDRLKTGSRGVIAQVNWGNEPPFEPNKPSETLVAKIKDPLRVQEDRRDQWKKTVGGLKALADAKISFAVSSEGLGDPAEMYKSVRQAIAAGLPRQAALAALTQNAAALLGLDKRLGTLALGKLAHLTILNGPFDDERSKVRFVFVDGLRFEYNKDAAPVPAGSPAAAANLAATWQVEIEAADGKVAATLDLTQNGSNLAGSFRSPQGEGKVSSGKIDGTKFDFVVAIGAGAQTIELKFSGTTETVAEGKLAGTLKSAFGAATKFSATKKLPGEPGAKNPVALTIDTGSDPKAPASPDKAAQAAAGEFPVELEADRLQHPLVTGGNVLIKGGTVITGQGEPRPNTSVLVKQGKIVAVGPDLAAEPEMTVIDAAGRFVMPGIIDTHSHIMFADGMGGVNEGTVSIVPEVRVKDVVRSNDPSAYRALAGGVTAARLLHGSANVVGGQDAVVKLKFGRPAREQIVQGNPQGVKFALGENVKFQTNRFPNTRLGVEATLNRAFLEAVDYRRIWMEYKKASDQKGTVAGSGSGAAAGAENPASAASGLLPPRRDLRLEALADIVEHQKFIHSHCYRADEILMLLRVTSELGIRVWSLQHVLEGYKVAPEIVAHGASCSTFADWWAYKVEAFDATPYNAALLAEAGANVVLKSDDAELIRHLYLESAKMVRYGGAAPDAALRMITLNSARELGLEGRMGSIEPGKDADLAIFSGHPLSAFSRCEMTIIDGEVFFVREKQPSAMSEAAALASAKPGQLTFSTPEIRSKQLDLTASPDRRYAITGATVHPVDAPDIERGTVLVQGDKIIAAGATVEIPAGTKTIDATGLHVYPGLIDAGTVLGLIEIGRVRETHDYQEAGQFQPDLRAGVAVNPDSELIPVTRAGGITTALVRPTGGIICGQTSIIKLDGWTVPEMVLTLESGLQIDWPGGNENQPRIDQLRDFLNEGRTYAKLKKAAEESKTTPPIRDPRYESLGPYLRGEKRIFVEANSRKEIVETLLFAEKEELKIVLTGARDAWKLASELKKREIPVIVGAVMARPFEEYDPFDAAYANPGRLHEAGVLFCIRSNGFSTAGFSASNARNMPFEAAQAVAYGLPEAEALKAVTLNAAKIIQADDKLGSLTAGKLANLVITDGSPLQETTQYKAIFIAGRPYPPESRHTRLYDKYRARLHEVRAQKP